jgi:hypothetical protein
MSSSTDKDLANIDNLECYLLFTNSTVRNEITSKWIGVVVMFLTCVREVTG